MLVILLPDQIAEYWDELKYYIESALPMHKSKGYDMGQLFMHVLGGVLLIAVFKDKENKIVAVFTITVVRDAVTGVNNLEIVTGYAIRYLEKDEVEGCLVTLKPLAKSKDCRNIMFYTDIEKSIESFKQGGAQVHTHLIWEV
jgi:hypothetical protein